MSSINRVRWLRFGCVLTAGFGLLIAASAVPALAAPVAFLFDLVFFPVDGAPLVAGHDARLLAAISGGLMVGLGVMLWIVATELYVRDPALGRRLILYGIGSWFVVDSTMSIAAGAPLNVLGNVAFLLVFCLPVWSPVPATETPGARHRVGDA